MNTANNEIQSSNCEHSIYGRKTEDYQYDLFIGLIENNEDDLDVSMSMKYRNRLNSKLY